MKYVNPNAKVPGRKLSELDNHEKHDLIPEALRVVLANMVATSRNVTCHDCGSATDLRQITIFGVSRETWKISLPICETCAFFRDSEHAGRLTIPEVRVE